MSPMKLMIHDWEVQEAYRQYKRRYGADALDHLTRMLACGCLNIARIMRCTLTPKRETRAEYPVR